MKRLLSPSLNPAGWSAAVAAVYALVTMILNLTSHRGAFSAPVVIAAASAVLALWTRHQVTPLAGPEDTAGRALAPPPPVTAGPGTADVLAAIANLDNTVAGLAATVRSVVLAARPAAADPLSPVKATAPRLRDPGGK